MAPTSMAKQPTPSMCAEIRAYLAAQHPQCLATLGQLPAHQLLHRTGIGDVVGQWRKVIQPVRVGHELVVMHVLRDLLVTPVEKADIGIAFVMISPSSSRISRSTPWVAGWDGPMLRVSFSPTKSSVVAS